MFFAPNNNYGYKWTNHNRVSFKGYIQNRISGMVFKALDATKQFECINSLEELTDYLKLVEGVFSVVIECDDGTILAAVDRSRSMPLYYSMKLGIVSDNAQLIIDNNLNYNFEIDENQYMALFASDYLFGRHTVYKEIEQLDLGEAVYLKDGSTPVFKRYYTHIQRIGEQTKEQYFKHLNSATLNAFNRIKRVIGDRPVVLSMSGGYDSRFVGCMLKNVGINNVYCYTYGKSDSFEVKQSKRNAEALGFKWIFVEYTDEEVKRVLDEDGKQYLFSYGGHDFTAYVQNYPAVRKLNELGWIKKEAVFLTGLCGDMPTGNYILPYDSNFIYNSETAAERLYNLIFTRFKMSDSFRNNWITEIKMKIEDLPYIVEDYQSWVSAVDCIYTGTCHSHWFMHMNTVHDYFGYEWVLPFWDSELLNMWYSIPAKERIGQQLYEDWLFNEIFSQYGVAQKKYRAMYSTNKKIRKLKYIGGSVLSSILLNAGIPFRRKYDYSNFAPLELELFKALPDKKTVIYRKAGLPLLINQYVLQNRYGTRIMQNAIKDIKVTL